MLSLCCISEVSGNATSERAIQGGVEDCSTSLLESSGNLVHILACKEDID